MCRLMLTGRLRTQAGSQDFIILCSYSGARIQKYNISFCVNSCFIHEQFPHSFILQPEKQSEGDWKRCVHKLQRCDFLETASYFGFVIPYLYSTWVVPSHSWISTIRVFEFMRTLQVKGCRRSQQFYSKEQVGVHLWKHYSTVFPSLPELWLFSKM